MARLKEKAEESAEIKNALMKELRSSFAATVAIVTVGASGSAFYVCTPEGRALADEMRSLDAERRRRKPQKPEQSTASRAPTQEETARNQLIWQGLREEKEAGLFSIGEKRAIRERYRAMGINLEEYQRL